MQIKNNILIQKKYAKGFLGDVLEL